MRKALVARFNMTSLTQRKAELILCDEINHAWGWWWAQLKYTKHILQIWSFNFTIKDRLELGCSFTNISSTLFHQLNEIVDLLIISI